MSKQKPQPRPQDPPGVLRERSAIFESMKAGKSDSMSFIVERSKTEPGRSISEPALAELLTSLQDFVGARILHYWEDPTAIGPQRIEAVVKLTIDGIHVEVPDDEYPWFVIGGEGRLG